MSLCETLTPRLPIDYAAISVFAAHHHLARHSFHGHRTGGGVI
jgi:hypothetical protein